jgi:hypothetical protein
MVFDDFRRFPMISNQFQSLFEKNTGGRVTTDEHGLTQMGQKPMTRTEETGVKVSKTKSRLIKVNQGWPVKALNIKVQFFGD